MTVCGLCRRRTAEIREVKIAPNGQEADPLVEDEVCPACVEYLGNIVHPAFELAAGVGIPPVQAIVVRVLLEELDELGGSPS